MKKSEKGVDQAKIEKSSSNLTMKSRIQRVKNKLLSAYYGNPIRDMKLICVAGTEAVAVARLTHEILKAAGLSSAVLASDGLIKAKTLQKFFNEAWKAKNHYVVVTASAESLKRDVFYGLPIHVAVLTGLEGDEAMLEATKSVFIEHPAIVVLNRDDVHYDNFAQFIGATDTYTYGRNVGATVRIDHSKLYAKGTEANLIFGNKAFTVASFLTGDSVVGQMTAAATIATALHVAPATIAEGVANLETLESTETEQTDETKA